jgi:hypothetical protein
VMLKQRQAGARRHQRSLAARLTYDSMKVTT